MEINYVPTRKGKSKATTSLYLPYTNFAKLVFKALGEEFIEGKAEKVSVKEIHSLVFFIA